MRRIYQMKYAWNRFCVTVIFLFNIIGIATGIKCYQCSALKFTRQTSCPGSLLYDFPRGDFCRLIALSDGRVINQEVVTETLCREASVRYTKGKIGQDFLDTAAQVLCCKWDGCNSDINSAKLSKFEYEQYLLQQILGSEYDHFMPFDKSEQLDGGESTKDGLETQLNSPSSDTANESVTSNRRIGTFHYGSTFHKNYNENEKITSMGDSKIFSDGFPKYFKPQLQGASVLRKQGVEQGHNKDEVKRKNNVRHHEDIKTINQTKVNPWIKIREGDERKNNGNQFPQSTKKRLNQLQMIASGGLSSSFYDQLLYYTRQKNGFNLFGEKEKSRTSEVDLQLTRESTSSKEKENKDFSIKLNEEKKESNNESIPLHSLTKLHCDPSRNCANNQASPNYHIFEKLNLSNVKIHFHIYFIQFLLFLSYEHVHQIIYV